MSRKSPGEATQHASVWLKTQIALPPPPPAKCSLTHRLLLKSSLTLCFKAAQDDTIGTIHLQRTDIDVSFCTPLAICSRWGFLLEWGRGGGGLIHHPGSHTHGSSVWQTMQRYNAAGDRRKRRLSGSVSDTEVKIQTSSRQRQPAVPQPAPSNTPPPPHPRLLPCWVGRKTAQVHKNAINWFIRNILKGRAIYFLQSRRWLSLFTHTPLALTVRCHA